MSYFLLKLIKVACTLDCVLQNVLQKISIISSTKCILHLIFGDTKRG